MDNIGYLLMKVSKELRYVLAKELAVLDLTPSQLAVLKRLELEEDLGSSLNSRTAVEIASKLDFDKPTISGIVNRLNEKGMVRKEQHPKDKRATILCLTDKAKELIPELEMISNQVVEKAFIHFSSKEKGLFLLLLKKMDQSLGKEEQT